MPFEVYIENKNGDNVALEDGLLEVIPYHLLSGLCLPEYEPYASMISVMKERAFTEGLRLSGEELRLHFDQLTQFMDWSQDLSLSCDSGFPSDSLQSLVGSI